MEQYPRDKTIIYARKSTESEDRQVLSIDSQVAELMKFAEQSGIAVVKIYQESKSAKAPGRPIFSQMMAELGKNGASSILCWKLDRLARNPVDGGALIWAMEERNLAKILTPQRSFNNTGNDKFWMQLEFGMAKKYVDDLSDNTKRGLRAKLEMGWKPGPPPLGYLNDKETKTIIRDPERFALLRRMWDLMLLGNHSASEVLRIATDQWGLRSRKFKRIGGGKVAYSGIHDILTNPFYYGRIAYGGELYQGAHEPMVTKSEFDRVQGLLTSRSWSRPKKLEFKYRGLMCCGECGCSITAECKVKPSGRRYVYYHCTKRKRNVRCSQGSIEEKELEEQILKFLSTLSIRRSFLDWALRVMRELEGQEVAQVTKVRESLEKRVIACDREKDELVNLRLRGLLDDGEFAAKRAQIEDERQSLQESMNGLEDRSVVVTEQCEELLDFAHTAKNSFLHGSDSVKRDILSRVGSNCFIMNKTLRIEAKKPLECIRNYVAGSGHLFVEVRTQDFGLDKHRSRPLLDGFCASLRAVKEVRTFVREETMNRRFIPTKGLVEKVCSEP